MQEVTGRHTTFFLTKHQFQREAVNRGLNDLHGFVGNQSCDATPLRGRTAEEVAMEKNSKSSEMEANRFLVAAVTFSPLLSSAFLREALQQVSDRTSPTASSLLAGSERKVSTRVELKLEKEKKKAVCLRSLFFVSRYCLCGCQRP